MWFLISSKRSYGAPYFFVTGLDEQGPSAPSVQEGATPNRQKLLSQTLYFLHFPFSTLCLCLQMRPLIHRSAVGLRKQIRVSSPAEKISGVISSLP